MLYKSLGIGAHCYQAKKGNALSRRHELGRLHVLTQAQSGEVSYMREANDRLGDGMGEIIETRFALAQKPW
jgi:hypothetical protein